MKSTTFYLIIVLILLNCLLAFKILVYKKSIKANQQKISVIKENYSSLIHGLESYIDRQIQLEKDLHVVISSIDHFKQNNRSSIVLIFSENYCFTCIQRILQDFSLLNDRTGFNDFIIIGAFESEEEFSQIQKKLNVDFECSWIYNNNVTIGRLIYPFVFVLNPNSEIRFLYSPEILPDKRSWYFYTLLEEYITKCRS